MPNIRARTLRMNMTDAEKCLWAVLRGRRLRGYKFRRQRPVGPYILDFVCIEYRLVIEADGGQHADNAQDDVRTAWLAKAGWRVIRFWKNDILSNSEGVQETILQTLETLNVEPSPSRPEGRVPPSPASGRGD